MHWHIASAGIKSCLCKQNYIIEKFHAKPKAFEIEFCVGSRVKQLQIMLKVDANIS